MMGCARLSGAGALAVMFVVNDFALQVFHEGDKLTEIVSCDSAAGLMSAVPEVLQKHPDCAAVSAFAGHVKLFSVDARGARLDD